MAVLLRFRAWDKKLKEMFGVSFIDYDTKLIGLNIDLEVIIFDFDDVILMQSTGLFDKNGQEIFEGDIIRTGAYGCIVGFGEYTYFEEDDSPTTEIGFFLSFLNVTPATYAPFDKYYWDNCEVIGNIYENELDLIMYEAYKYNKTASEADHDRD